MAPSERPKNVAPIDDARLDELARWAASLLHADLADLRAAGRSIAALCDEVARLRAALPPEDRDTTPPAGATKKQPSPRRTRTVFRRPRNRSLLVALAVCALLALAAVVVGRLARPDVPATGPPSGALIGARALETAAVRLPTRDGMDASWSVDGRTVAPQRHGETFVLPLKTLADGRHDITVTRRESLFLHDSRRFRFTVDTTPPVVRLTRPATIRRGGMTSLVGTAEPFATLGVAGRTVRLGSKGTFSTVVSPRTRSLVMLATDAAGNASRWRITVAVAARRPSNPIRAVHVTAYGWSDKTLRSGILALASERRINAVELDLKDESGQVGWSAPVATADRIGAKRPIYDLTAAVRLLHARGVRVIGRLVCFRDPMYAAAAWKSGDRAGVVQTPSGGEYSHYGGFTNVANASVRRYNIELAVAAARAGVDEILYDYVRRPDGPISTMRFPGLHGTPTQAVTRFLTESRVALASSGVLVGASVFGVSATRPAEVAQDIPAIAREVDYVAPMVYPSHWGPGEYGVADPNADPYAIVRRSVADFVRLTRGTGARVVPWLQDFSLGRPYGPAEVRAQIRAARDAGANEFLLWDAAATYTAAALERAARIPATGLAPVVEGPIVQPVRLKAAPPVARLAPARQPVSGLQPDELGTIPVIMHHEVRRDRTSAYDQTPAELRWELEQLWRRGYVPITVSDLLDRRLDLPRGMSPVVLTFDDTTRSQLAMGPRGVVRPDTAVGVLRAFARTHPGFEPRGTMYVLREPFGGVADGGRLLRWLTHNGFELGNHTSDHLPLGTLSDQDVQHELVAGAALITSAVPGYRIRSMALPLGSMPKRPGLAVRGSWHGTSYGPYGVLLVGANPAPSPFSRAFDPAAIPRIRTSHLPAARAEAFTFAYWLDRLDAGPSRRYVSDGDPGRITVPAAQAEEVAPRFAARVVTVTGTG